MIALGKFLLKIIGWATVYVVLTIVAFGILLVILGIGGRIVSPCRGMECFGNSVIILFVSGLLSPVIAAFATGLLILRFEDPPRNRADALDERDKILRP